MRKRLLLFTLLVLILVTVCGDSFAAGMVSVGRDSYDLEALENPCHWPLTNEDFDSTIGRAMHAQIIDQYWKPYDQGARIEGIGMRRQAVSAEPAMGVSDKYYTTTVTGPHVTLYDMKSNRGEFIWMDDYYSISSVWSRNDENVFYFARLEDNNGRYPEVWVHNKGVFAPPFEGTLSFKADFRPAYTSVGVYKGTIVRPKIGLNKKPQVVVEKIIDGNYIPIAVSPDDESLFLKKLSKNLREAPYLEGEELGVYVYYPNTNRIVQWREGVVTNIVKFAMSDDGNYIAYSNPQGLYVEKGGSKGNPEIAYFPTGWLQSLTFTGDSKSLLATIHSRYQDAIGTFFLRTVIFDLETYKSELFLTNWFVLKDVSSQPWGEKVLFTWSAN